MSVKARLEGDVFDLEALARLFDHGDLRIGSNAEGYYLTSPDLDGAGNDGGKLLEAAQAAVLYANGVARVLTPEFQPVRVTGTFDSPAADGGGVSHQVVAVASIVVRSQLGAAVANVNGEVYEPPPSPAPDYLELVQTHPDVRDALRILGKPVAGLDWIDLWKVFEIVRANVGGPDALAAKAWVPEPDLKAFKDSANHQGASGDAARHARHTGPTPTNVLSIEQGREVMRRLVAEWMKTL